MTSALKRGRDEKGEPIALLETKRVWLSYDALCSMGVMCDKGRTFVMSGDTETTGCMYGHVHREAKHRKPSKMMYTRGRRRFICDLDQELVLGFCCVCGVDVSNLNSEQVTLQSVAHVLCDTISEAAAKKEPVLYLCVQCGKDYKVNVGDTKSELTLKGKLTWYDDCQKAIDTVASNAAAKAQVMSKAKPLVAQIQKLLGRKLTALELRQLERLPFAQLLTELATILAKYSAAQTPLDSPFLELASRFADSK